MSTVAQPAPLPLPRNALPTLRKSDPRLAWLIKRVGPFAMPSPQSLGRGHLEALCRSIVYQQLSGKAAATIFGRFRKLWETAQFPTAQQILAQPDETLRGCGLSGQKVSYLRDLCQKLVDQPHFLADVETMEDEAIIARLTSVKGLGRWTSEMFLMFHLGRLDVWPVGDLGVRKAVQRLHFLDELPPPKQMQELGARYAPYRSIASWYLWRLLELPDEVPAQL
jgi:DNA-3-methyladenine glycosylase II